MSKKLNHSLVTVPFGRMLIGLPGHTKSAFNRCVGGKLRGTRGGPTAFTSAVKECKGTKGK